MCGIFGIINREIEPFDYQSFCTLGIGNDRRGGDSCGIFIDGAVEYGINEKAKFENFFWSSDLLNNTATAKIALGHDRKASVGGISLEKAHPIIIKEIVGEGETAHEEIKFVMVHNGTVYNYEDLAKKYIPDVDIKNMSDSQVIARLLYHVGFDWLSEYNGGAAFIAVDYREKEPKVLIWRGESKKYSVDKTVEEERPLYCNLDNGRLVISSIASYLQVIDGNCYLVPANKVLTYKNNKLIIIKEIDRSNATQTKAYTTYTSNYSGRNQGYNNNQSWTPLFITVNEFTNTYKIGTAPADGLLRLTSYGKILSKYDSIPIGQESHQVYFFNGIALMDRRAFVFLCKAHKRTKLSTDDFTKSYQNLIRYFSVDQVYPENSVFYKAIAPFERSLFTGGIQMLGESCRNYYDQGVRNHKNHISTVHESFAPMKEIRNYDYKTIWKKFIQSMP